MSFVLEALKKQEAGSDPDAAVSLARAGVQRRRHRFWMVLFAAAMAANAALLVWVFVLPAAPEPTAARQPTTAAEPPSGAAGASPAAGERASTDRHQAGWEAPVSEPPRGAPQSPPARSSAESAPEATQRSAAAASTARPAPPARVSLDDLPAAARSRFPGIAFSTHVFAEDADLRAVVANGRRVTEGGSIRGLTVVEITESGVVLAFERYEVEVPIVMDWDSL